MKVLLHVNYCEGQGRLDELFDLALEFGYDGLELRWRYAFSDYTQEGYQNKVAEFKQRHPELELVFGGGVKFCRNDPEKVKRETAEYLSFLPWAKEACGTSIMNGMTGTIVVTENPFKRSGENGSYAATEEDYEAAAAGLRIVGARADELGMKIALETHGCYLHDNAKSCRKLLDLTGCPAVGLNYDQGNIIGLPTGESIDEVFALVGDKIFYAHLKNAYIVSGQYLPAPLRYGSINTDKILKQLKQLKLPFVATEFPSSGDSIIAAKEDVEYMRFLLARLAK